MSRYSYGVDEIEVYLTISDGKLTVESRSGAKNGSLDLEVGEFTAEVTLNTGSDRATATLTGPELSNFRTNIDAGLSAMVADNDSIEHDQRVLDSGFQTLGPIDEGFGMTLDSRALQALGIVDEDHALPGGSRQVKCTVLNSGTAIVNLLSDDETPFTF